MSTHNYLVISALGPDRPHIVSELTRACTLNSCNLLNAKVNVLGTELAITLFVSGHWGAIAKMEANLMILEKDLGLTLMARRSATPSLTAASITYTIQVFAIDKSGILQGLADFLFRSTVPVEEISAHTYLTHTATRMVSLTLKVNVPDKMHLASFREQLLNYCEENNLDVLLEPLRTV
jgi:glycine cleavage system transcriptional repressor